MAASLDNDTVAVIRSVLHDTHPPTNPAVLLLTMRDWYLAYGSGSVLRAMTDWLAQVVMADCQDPLDYYCDARIDFASKTEGRVTA